MPTTPLTQQTFNRTVTGHHIVLVEFWASWCSWCSRFAPIYQQSAASHPDIVHATVDGEAEQALMATSRVDAFPWLMGFREGTLVYSQAGFLPGEQLEELVQHLRWMDIEAFRREHAVAPEQAPPVDAAPSRLAGPAPGTQHYGWPGL